MKSNKNIKSVSLEKILESKLSTKAFIKYILSVNISLRNQLKSMKMYIEIQNIFIYLLYQQLEKI